ncbi:adenosylcobinamide-phosphate synthase CbiB [Pararhizobium mangrovi]|uniref:Cobalamin biosynthesis protein CobD n=1 Tax=Pararhizobium mangrovi TaxID=2590452 RepID=A0A506UD99_9HYPH|nr:adenosylcobinamide-phosphate synthase CbiB [Pararhizobium mangrovi]TPW31386.1 cobalamin biosynthesis protein [Pararhizobium mangrovi]
MGLDTVKMHLAILAVALLLDRIVGDPDWLWQRFRHPVVLFGAVIGWLEGTMNGQGLSAWAGRLRGGFAVAAILAIAVVSGELIGRFFAFIGGIGILLEIAVVAVFLAQKSLAEHVARVARALQREGLSSGRKAVSMIVGRDPATLDEAGVARAAIESLAENFADGVVAPAFWYLVFGLPGLFAYKMVNTADSMIGHRSARYRDFGFAAARLDDAVNWLPARISAGLIALAVVWRSGKEAGRRAVRAAWRDAPFHRSPNAGWPEAAMAGSLGLSLGGPRSYGGIALDEPAIHAEGRREATPADIERAIALYRRTCTVLLGLVALSAIVA